jgi:hypothetical protein
LFIHAIDQIYYAHHLYFDHHDYNEDPTDMDLCRPTPDATVEEAVAQELAGCYKSTAYLFVLEAVELGNAPPDGGDEMEV